MAIARIFTYVRMHATSRGETIAQATIDKYRNRTLNMCAKIFSIRSIRRGCRDDV